MSAGFQAVMGYLHIGGGSSRLEELIDWCIQQVEEGKKAVKNIREWFPHAEVTDQEANPPTGYVTPFPFGSINGCCWKEEELTRREKQLISWLGGEERGCP